MSEIKNLLIGLEINADYSQMTYYGRSENDAISVPVRAGTSEFIFPTSLCRLLKKDEWKFGTEAEYFITHRNGIEVRNPFEIWNGHESYKVLNVSMTPAELLAVYVRAVLSHLGVNDVIKNIKGIAITTDSISFEFAKNVRMAFAILGFSEENSFILDNMQSFFYFSMYHGCDVTRKDVGMFRIDDSGIEFKKLQMNFRKLPASAGESIGEYLSIGYDEPDYSEKFYRFTENILEKNDLGHIYIIQRNFDNARAEKAVRLMCMNERRVFAGDNIFAKGACYAAFDKTETNRLKNNVYTGKNSVLYNIGMNLTIKERQTYYPFSKAGENFFDADDEIILLLRDEEPCISISVSEQGGGNRKNISFRLDGIEGRMPGTTKIKLRAFFRDTETFEIEACDLGFGGIVQPTGKHWHFTVDLSEPLELSFDNEYPEGENVRLCVEKKVEIPYLVDSIGMMLYSIDELAYFMFNYPELCDGEVINDSLLEWIEKDAGMVRLAGSLRSLPEKGYFSNFICRVISESGYLRLKEAEGFRNALLKFAGKSEAERLKAKGDVLVELGKYTGAMNAYRKAASGFSESSDTDKIPVVSALYHNIAVIYMKLLMYDMSVEYFKKAYDVYHTREGLKNYMTAAAISMPRSRYEALLRKMHVGIDLAEEIDRTINSEIAYEVPGESDTPKEILKKLVDEYKYSAGMPEY